MSSCQLMAGFSFQSHWKPKTILQEEWSLVTKKQMICLVPSGNMTGMVTYFVIGPEGAWDLSKRWSSMGFLRGNVWMLYFCINSSDTNLSEEPESMRAAEEELEK